MQSQSTGFWIYAEDSPPKLAFQPSNEIRLLMADMLDEVDTLPPVEEESEAPPIKSAFEVDLLQPTEPTTTFFLEAPQQWE